MRSTTSAWRRGSSFGGLPAEDADLRNVKPVDAQKFDMKVDA